MSVRKEHFINENPSNSKYAKVLMNIVKTNFRGHYYGTFEDFQKLDMRIGEITRAENFSEVRKPAYKLWVDFGEEIGIKQSSAQITDCYDLNELVGKQVLGVVNFPPMRVADFSSEVL